jgi:hypothetical protein
MHVFLGFAFSKFKENKNEPEYLIGIATIQTQEPSQNMVSDSSESHVVHMCLRFSFFLVSELQF